MPRFPSPEWAREYCEELNKSESYARAAKGWVWPILFVVRDGERRGFLLRLNNGKCEGVEWYDNPDEADAPYVLEATLDDWLRIIRGEINPLTAIMRRKLVLAKGSYSMILRYPIAALEMVKAAQRVPIE